MKKPFIAFLLSLMLPGAGLAYLGKWRWAIINLVVVLLVGVLAALLLPEGVFDWSIRYIAIGCAGGSGGLAQQLAREINQQAKSDDAV
jgi:hypothetical protein